MKTNFLSLKYLAQVHAINTYMLKKTSKLLKKNTKKIPPKKSYKLF